MNAACSAWNIACGSPETRERQLEQFAASFLRHNPGTSPAGLADTVNDMETLIERKQELFPDDYRRIVEARAVKVGSNFRIEVVSAMLR